MAFNNAVDATQTGFQSLTSAGVWQGRTLTAGTGISISNGDGIAGNPQISSTSSGTAAWTFIETRTMSAGFQDFNTSISTYTELMFVLDQVVVNPQAIQIRCSTDNGGTFQVLNGGLYNSGASYNTTSTASLTGGGAFNLLGEIRVQNITGTQKKPLHSFISNTGNGIVITGQFVSASSAQFNLIRLQCAGGGNFGGGNIIVYGRG